MNAKLDISTILTPAARAAINRLADAHAAPMPKRTRRGLLEAHRRAVEKGEAPPPLELASIQNYSYAARADRILKLGRAGDLDGLQTIEVKGTNTYARALRSYRDLWVTYLQSRAVEAKEP